MKNFEQGVFIPEELLKKVGISPEGGIAISYSKGAIIIMQEDIVDVLPYQVKELLDELGISLETARAVLAEDDYLYDMFANMCECCEYELD